MAFQGMNIARLRQAVLDMRESVVGDLSATFPTPTDLKQAVLDMRESIVGDISLTLPTPSLLYSSFKTRVSANKVRSNTLTATELFYIPEITWCVFQFLGPRDLVNLEQVAKVFRDNDYLNYTWLELCKVKWYGDIDAFIIIIA